MDATQFAAALAGMTHGADPERPKIAPDAEQDRLREAFAELTLTHCFEPGMIVRQKPQARLYKDYGDNGLGIVIELISPPIVDEGQPTANPYYRQRLDMIIGSIEQDPAGDFFLTYHVDSRRFEPVLE